MIAMGGLKELVQACKQPKNPRCLTLKHLVLDRQCLRYLIDVVSNKKGSIESCSFLNVGFADDQDGEVLINLLKTFLTKHAASLHTLEIQHRQGQIFFNGQWHPRTRFSSVWATVLTQSAPRLTQLGKLKLDNMRLQGPAAADCLKILCQALPLTQLSLRNCTFDEQCWKHLFGGMRERIHEGSFCLRKLDFCFCKDEGDVTREVMNNALLETLEHIHEQSRDKQYYKHKTMGSNPSVTGLALDGQGLTSGCIVTLSRIIQENDQLQTLYLPNNFDLLVDATSEECKQFGMAVGAHPALRTVCLTGCSVGNELAMHLFGALEQNQQTSALQQLFLQQNRHLTVRKSASRQCEPPDACNGCCWIDSVPQLLTLRTLILPTGLSGERLCHYRLAQNISLTTVRFFDGSHSTDRSITPASIQPSLARNARFSKAQSLIHNKNCNNTGDQAAASIPASLIPWIVATLAKPSCGRGANATPVFWAVQQVLVGTLGARGGGESIMRTASGKAMIISATATKQQQQQYITQQQRHNNHHLHHQKQRPTKHNVQFLLKVKRGMRFVVRGGRQRDE